MAKEIFILPIFWRHRSIDILNFWYPDPNGNRAKYKSMLWEFNSPSVETMSDRWISNLFNLLVWCKCPLLELDTVIYSLENLMSADIPNMDYYFVYICVKSHQKFKDLSVLLSTAHFRVKINKVRRSFSILFYILIRWKIRASLSPSLLEKYQLEKLVEMSLKWVISITRSLSLSSVNRSSIQSR